MRGRIGRRAYRAYAYLLVPKGRRITDGAQRRLHTLLAATELGAGFRIAMKDLEIRGAGNLLGAEQSGHIHAVGFDLYTRLLAEAVEEVRAQGAGVGLRERDMPEPHIDLGLPAFIPQELVEDMAARMALYQRLARARGVEEVEEVGRAMKDRFGRLPEEVHHLLYCVRVRVLAYSARLESVVRRGDEVTLKLWEAVGGARLALQKALGPGVRVGHQQVHVSVSSGAEPPWGQALLEVLEGLEAFRRRVAELVDVGT